ncbi:MAG: Asp23/Gls24 family envelope stress response protein [Christensenellaceae bacterium]|jgi:uncharacterized alkaline shock family protein YloU|nr:Asp23/Gls24 family envelope stress response protein [Christensenellaceae bacterium]
MAINTSNLYGNIYVSKKAIRAVAGIATLECYGVWGVGGRRTVRNVQSNFKPKTGVRIWTVGNKIGVYIDIIVCFGMPINSLITSIRKTIKYKVENYSGMVVSFVDIRIMGIRK